MLNKRNLFKHTNFGINLFIAKERVKQIVLNKKCFGNSTSN